MIKKDTIIPFILISPVLVRNVLFVHFLHLVVVPILKAIKDFH